MINITDILKQLPEMKSGEELLTELEVLPEYDPNVIYKAVPERLMALSDIYQIYVPNDMSQEIYSKLYLSMLRSLQKKCMKEAVRQRYENHKAIKQQTYTGLIGGSDSFTIIGNSGIGKSSSINRAISIISKKGIIEIMKPYTRIIPCVVIQCPFDCSVKGMLLEILRKVDERLESNYYANALRARATTDMLIGSVSQVALNHIGLLIVDEIQNVVNSKNGKSLVGVLTQLINNAGISICMVGMNESKIFFEQGMQLARRSLGLQYEAMDYGTEFRGFCKILFDYQYVRKQTEMTDQICYWLYEHSGGNAAVVVSLIHDAQEIGILTGKETLNLETLQDAYQKRLSLLHEYIQPSISKNKQTSTIKKSTVSITEKNVENSYSDFSIADTVKMAKETGKDIVLLLKEHFQMEEVQAG